MHFHIIQGDTLAQKRQYVEFNASNTRKLNSFEIMDKRILF